MERVRKTSIKKHTRTFQETLLLYGIGSVACIYFGLLCGATWLPGNDLNTFLENFQEFILHQKHFLVGVTEMTPVFIAGFWISFSLLFLLFMTKIEHPYAGEEYGVARWGNAKAFTKQFADHDPKNVIEVVTGDATVSEKLTVNCKNYWLAEGVYLSIDNVKTSNLNMLVVGPPGSGKSFRLARPLLSQLCGNFLVTDPKGELYKQSGQYFEDNGYEGMPMSIHFNPFEYIRNESDLMSIAGILMKATTPPEDSGGNDQFFEQSAEVLLTSILYIIKYFYPKEKRNWAEFVKLLNATTVYSKPDGSIDNRKGGILEIATKAQHLWKKTHDTDFPGYVAIEKYYNGAAETTSSIVASLDAHCRYMKLQCVIDLLSEDEIKIGKSFGYSRPDEQSRTGKRILFLVTSEDKRYYDWIPSMVYSLFFDELYHLTAIDPSLHETLPQHLTFLMDEFANVTLPDSFVEKLSTMRSRNMSAVIIVQNLIQLKRKFPKFDMDKDLIGNCSIIDILGAPDMDSCEYLAKHFGTQTIHKASDSDAKDHKGSSSRSEDVMQKPLLSAEDIFAMKKDGECAIVIKGTEPLFEPKCKMEKTSFVKLLCRKNPYRPEKSREKKKALQSKEGSFFFSGEKAKEEAKKIRASGQAILKLTEEDVDALILSSKLGSTITTLPVTEEMQKKLKENYDRYLDEKMDGRIDFSIYKEKNNNSKEAKQRYVQRAETVQNLLQSGYTKTQIRCLYELIMADYSAKRIKEMFPTNVALDEIKNFAKIL